jgi:hypothetical protein
VGLTEGLDPADDSLTAWTERYLDLADLDAPSLEAVRAITELNRKLAALAQPEATVSTPRADNPGIPPSEPGQTRS